MRERLRDAGVDPERPEVQRAIMIAARMYAGPIPPAEMLSEYEALQPGLAERIIGWTEDQQRHRRGLELLTTRGSEKRMDRGQLFSFGIAGLGIIAAAIVASYNTNAAIAVIAVCVGGPAVATVVARIIAPGPSRRDPRPEPINDARPPGRDVTTRTPEP